MSKAPYTVIVLVLLLFVSVGQRAWAASINAQPAAISEEQAQGSEERVQGFPAQTVAAGEVLQMVFALGLVLGVIALVAWFLRRLPGLQRGAHRNLQILEGISLGTRERLVLVQVGEQQLLLGVCPGQIRTLHVLKTPIPVSPHSSRSPFARHLERALKPGEYS
ncbi:flagellar biosynthesis protein FliO [Nitrosococcus halophilus Nc 4]|uniref:Flagellar protein n=1 Tax=Nitrosococcus halophilus (strain Nc4) TaxID=472759 RepID=D5C252_NITHN|nr:flagellar biosynthetic protein FliO [Nitrosococcus halophilus]ADE16640.1 flagellar biosynthesis protein FliO [Nitrosococcus halophilus Nc 4]